VANDNAKTAIAKRLAAQIMNTDRIHEKKKFSVDNEKQSEKRKREVRSSLGAATGNA